MPTSPRSRLPPLPGSQGLPIQFVIKTIDSFDKLNDTAQQFLKAAIGSGMSIFLDSDLKIDIQKPWLRLIATAAILKVAKVCILGIPKSAEK